MPQAYFVLIHIPCGNSVFRLTHKGFHTSSDSEL